MLYAPFAGLKGTGATGLKLAGEPCSVSVTVPASTMLPGRPCMVIKPLTVALPHTVMGSGAPRLCSSGAPSMSLSTLSPIVMLGGAGGHAGERDFGEGTGA